MPEQTLADVLRSIMKQKQHNNEQDLGNEEDGEGGADPQASV